MKSFASGVTLLLVLTASSCASRSNDPDFVTAEAANRKAIAAINGITASDERALGQAASIELIRVHGGLVLDDSVIRYVNEVGNLVAMQGKRRVLVAGQPRMTTRRVFVGVIDNPLPNSWSLPGGYIFVSRGLLELLSSESELAWVIAREVAHIDGEHGLRVLKSQLAMSSIVAGDPRFLKDSKTFAKSVDALIAFSLKGRTGEDDRYADKWGLEYATKAGYDPEGARRVLALAASLAAAAPGLPSKKEYPDTPERRYQKLAPLIAASPAGAVVSQRYDERCLKHLEAYALTKSPAP